MYERRHDDRQQERKVDPRQLRTHWLRLQYADWKWWERGLRRSVRTEVGAITV
jgi:hypothetical protein